MLEKTDEEIALDVQKGDIQAFGILIERYEDKISRYARKFLFGGEDAKDVVQEVFIKTYVNIKSFDPKQRFSPWIYRIAHNEFINTIKKRSRMPILFFDGDTLLPHPIAEETAEGEVERKELRQILDRSLDKISPKYREPLVLYYFEEMNYKEIADILEIPTSTVGIRLRRGKALLKKVMPNT